MLIVVTAIVALVIGAAAGWAMGRRRSAGDADDRGPAPLVHHTLLTQVVRAMATGVLVIDRDERVVLTNPAARAMHVHTAGRLTTEQLLRLVRSATDSATTVACAADLPMGRLGREPVAVAASAVPLRGEDGRVAMVVLLLEDVTEQRRLDAVRRDFVANVSHELKTPVGALTLLAEAVQGAADDPEAVQRFAGRMQHEGARLGRLVRELIELSRLQGAEPLPGAHRLSLATVVAEAVDRTRLAAEQAGIVIAARVAEDLVVQGNTEQLTTALVNLIDNALAYSPRDTRVAISARGVDDGEARVEVSVSDQGIGIAEIEIDRVFERFYRIDPARSRATGGTGLGLAIVKHIATNHGGSVSVWSVEGAGSTFTIRLPRVQQGSGSSDEGSPVESVREPV